MEKSCCWMVDLSAPMARPPSVTRGAILRGRASVVSLGIERASGRLRAVGPSCVCVNASCAREPLSLACSPVRWRLGPGRWRPGSLHVHVNPMGGGLGALPTMPPIGFSCALTGYCACSGFAREQHARPGAVVPTSQTTSPTTPDCQRFSPRWSALWAPHQPKPRADRHQMGGNCAVRGARLSSAYVEGATKRGELHQ